MGDGHGHDPADGTFASVATRPYDNTTWGGNVISMKTGWSNDSALQLNYQRPFRKGFAYQIFYVYSRAFRVGGNTFRDNVLYPAANFAPGVLPAGLDAGTTLNPSQALNRYENYKVDTAIPVHHIAFNGIVDHSGRQGQALPGQLESVPECPAGRIPGGLRRPGGFAGLPGGLGELGRARARFRIIRVPPRSQTAAAACAVQRICGSTDTSRRP